MIAAWMLLAQSALVLGQSTPTNPQPLPQEDHPAPWVLPANSSIEFRLEREINTRDVRTGDVFPMSVSATHCLNGRQLTLTQSVEGRVVHAQKAGVFGKSAELLLTASPISLKDDVSITTRNLKPSVGRDRTAAAVGTSIVIGPFAAFIKGGNIRLPEGTLLVATTRQDVSVPLASTTACEEPSTAPPTQGSNANDPAAEHSHPPDRPDDVESAERARNPGDDSGH